MKVLIIPLALATLALADCPNCPVESKPFKSIKVFNDPKPSVQRLDTPKPFPGSNDYKPFDYHGNYKKSDHNNRNYDYHDPDFGMRDYHYKGYYPSGDYDYDHDSNYGHGYRTPSGRYAEKDYSSDDMESDGFRPLNRKIRSLPIQSLIFVDARVTNAVATAAGTNVAGTVVEELSGGDVRVRWDNDRFELISVWKKAALSPGVPGLDGIRKNMVVKTIVNDTMGRAKYKARVREVFANGRISLAVDGFARPSLDWNVDQVAPFESRY
ncbi:MAG: hypothetical protein HYR96_04245 [Deltaproteobacteria bacterium]|nr:hypothetical protein [Deltaproteobacteria bacterium]MBI3294595.1 hypothetical protein [Deltaproteobacteria bacterium]